MRETDRTLAEMQEQINATASNIEEHHNLNIAYSAALEILRRRVAELSRILALEDEDGPFPEYAKKYP